ncbi:MAG: PEP-CTERM sorting domain-containing protein [Verrucomicrobiales bacterium]
MDNFLFTGPVPVPEPSIGLLALLGSLGLLRRRKG